MDALWQNYTWDLVDRPNNVSLEIPEYATTNHNTNSR
jgi:hypothetical protein